MTQQQVRDAKGRSLKGYKPDGFTMSGRKHSPETKERMRQSALKRIKDRPDTLPDHTGHLKENPGYQALHAWIKKQLGKAKLCENCGATSDVQWANKTGEYLRKISDWLQLCRSCHRKYDMEHGTWKHPRFA